MKVLIVDNHSSHLAELSALFPDHSIIDRSSFNDERDLSVFGLLLISGGSKAPTVLRHPDRYMNEIETIRNIKIPTIGICLGSEIIATAFSGVLSEMPHPESGTEMIRVKDESLIAELGSDRLNVEERHHIGIKSIPDDFIVCADSDGGIEVFRHKIRPIIGFQFHPEISPNSRLWRWAMKSLKISTDR